MRLGKLLPKIIIKKVEKEAAAYGAKYSIADAIERTVCEFVSKTRIVNKDDEGI